MRVIICGAALWLIGCGGASSTDLTTSIARPAESSDAGTEAVSGGDAGGALAAAGGSTQSGGGGLAAAGSAVAAGGVSAGEAGGAGGLGGAPQAGGAPSVAGAPAGGATVTDPACAPSNTHALPAKCAAPAPVDCSRSIQNNPNACVGDGACPNEIGSVCAPTGGNDFSLCRDGRIGICDVGTCGTDAGGGCLRYQNDVAYPPEFCPCVVLGTILKG